MAELLVSTALSGSLPSYFLRLVDTYAVDIFDGQGFTALVRICQAIAVGTARGHTRTQVQALLARGADPLRPCTPHGIVALGLPLPQEIRELLLRAANAQARNMQFRPSETVQRWLQTERQVLWDAMSTEERKAYMSASERPQPAPVQPQPWCPPVLPNQGPSIHYPAARHPVPSDSFAERFSRTTIDASSPARRGFDDVLNTPLSTPPQYHQGYASTAAADAGRHARRAYQVQHLERRASQPGAQARPPQSLGPPAPPSTPQHASAPPAFASATSVDLSSAALLAISSAATSTAKHVASSPFSLGPIVAEKPTPTVPQPSHALDILLAAAAAAELPESTAASRDDTSPAAAVTDIEVGDIPTSNVRSAGDEIDEDVKASAEKPNVRFVWRGKPSLAAHDVSAFDLPRSTRRKRGLSQPPPEHVLAALGRSAPARCQAAEVETGSVVQLQSPAMPMPAATSSNSSHTGEAVTEAHGAPMDAEPNSLTELVFRKRSVSPTPSATSDSQASEDPADRPYHLRSGAPKLVTRSSKRAKAVRPGPKPRKTRSTTRAAKTDPSPSVAQAVKAKPYPPIPKRREPRWYIVQDFARDLPANWLPGEDQARSLSVSSGVAMSDIVIWFQRRCVVYADASDYATPLNVSTGLVAPAAPGSVQAGYEQKLAPLAAISHDQQRGTSSTWHDSRRRSSAAGAAAAKGQHSAVQPSTAVYRPRGDYRDIFVGQTASPTTSSQEQIQRAWDDYMRAQAALRSFGLDPRHFMTEPAFIDAPAHSSPVDATADARTLWPVAQPPAGVHARGPLSEDVARPTLIASASSRYLSYHPAAATTPTHHSGRRRMFQPADLPAPRPPYVEPVPWLARTPIEQSVSTSMPAPGQLEVKPRRQVMAGVKVKAEVPEAIVIDDDDSAEEMESVYSEDPVEFDDS